MKKKYTQVNIVFIDAKPCDILTSSFGYRSSFAGDVFDWDVFS